MKIHYVCAYRLNQEDLYLIWYNSKPDGVVVDPSGRVPAFRDRISLRDYVSGLGLHFNAEDEIVDNLDTVKQWLAEPPTDNVDCVDFLNAWNLFGDVAKSVGDTAFDNQTEKTNPIYEKLFLGNNLPGVSVKGASYDPSWSQQELELLHQTLAYGLKMFQSRVTVL